MNNTILILCYIGIMALVTYLVRMLPMIIFRKKITNRFINSILFYIPYAVLAAMTFPAIFTATDSVLSASIGCLVAIILALLDKGLLIVALSASAAVFIVEWILKLL